MNDAEKLRKIERIYHIQLTNHEDEEGDKYLSDVTLAMEAIGDVLAGTTSGNLRMFEEAGA